MMDSWLLQHNTCMMNMQLLHRAYFQDVGMVQIVAIEAPRKTGQHAPWSAAWYWRISMRYESEVGRQHGPGMTPGASQKGGCCLGRPQVFIVPTHSGSGRGPDEMVKLPTACAKKVLYKSHSGQEISPELGPDSALDAIQEAFVVGKDEELLVIFQQIRYIVLHSLHLHITPIVCSFPEHH